ncbi:unnamed protein product [Closterium sp. NIES-64]|nr:unnamed protein product [Closterium sp. NIES-64]
MVTLEPPSLRGVLPPPSYPLLLLLLRPTLLVSSRLALRLPLWVSAAQARARGARALEELAGAVEVAVEAVEGVGVVVGVVAGVEVSVAAVEAEAEAAVAVGAEVAEVAAEEEAAVEEAELVGVALRRGSAPVVRGGGTGPCPYVLRTGDRAGEQCGGAHSTQRCFGRLMDAWRHQFPEATEIPRWGELSRAGVAIFDLEFDSILAAMYAVTISDKGDCYRCFPPDSGIETTALGTGVVAALGASEATTLGASESASSGSGESVLSVLPCPSAPSGTLSGLYLPSFSTNLLSGADLQDGGVHQFTPTSQRTLLWHHRLGHPSLPRLRGMASRVLVSGLPRSLPPLPLGPAPACVPCVEGRQRAAPHSSQFSPTEAPQQTLHMDVWGPARVRGQGHERYFLLVVDDYSRYTTVFPLRSKGDVTEVLINWIRAARLQLSQSFGSDFPVLRVQSDRGGEFSSSLLRAYCRARGIHQTFTLPDSPQQNGIAGHRIGMVIDVARSSMMHAAAPHFLWPFAVRYAAHQINLQPRVSMPETSPTLLWIGKVGNASAFRGGSSTTPPLAVFCPLRTSHLTSRSPTTASSPTALRTPSLPPPPLFLVPGPPPVDPLPPQGPAPSGASQVDAVEPVEVAGDSGAAEGAEPEGADSGGSEPECATTGGAGPGGAEPGGAAPGGVSTGGAELGSATTGGAEPGGPTPGGAAPRGATTGGAEPGGATPAGAEPEGAGPARVASGGTVPGGSPSLHRSCTSGLPGAGGVVLELEVLRLLRVLLSRVPEVLVLGVLELLGMRVRLELELLRVLVLRLLLEVLELLELLGVLEQEVLLALVLPLAVLVLSLLCLESLRGLDRTSFRSFSSFLPASPLPAPSPYTGPTGGLAERREPVSCPASRVRPARASGRGSHQRPPLVAGRHRMSLRPSTAPLRAPLPSPESSLPALADPESDSLRAASPTVPRLLAIVVTDPSFESTAASALVAEPVEFAARCPLDYAASLVAESESACPPSVGGECALGTDVLEDRQEEFQCLAAASPHLVSVLLTPDALDIPTPRSYAEAIEGPYSSQWQAAMDTEMASWKSTGTYVDEVPPPGANIVSGMWIFRVKRPPDSPPVFKARYVARGFSQRQGVDYFQTFSPTPKMTTLRVLLHVAAHRDYELHSLDFSTAFLEGSLYEDIWLHRPSGFTGSFPPGTQWSLRRLVYGLRQAPREWHDTLRTTLAALGFAPSTSVPSQFLRTDTSLPPFYILVYVDNLVFATADTAGLAHVKFGLQKRHTCTDLGELRSYLGLQVTRDRARRTITLTQSHMVLLASGHSSAYSPLALSSAFG